MFIIQSFIRNLNINLPFKDYRLNLNNSKSLIIQNCFLTRTVHPYQTLPPSEFAQ